MDKKQIPLRISSKLYADLSRWAQDDFRSINGQIEYILTECVKQRKKMADMSAKSWICHWMWILMDLKQKRKNKSLLFFIYNMNLWMTSATAL